MRGIGLERKPSHMFRFFNFLPGICTFFKFNPLKFRHINCFSTSFCLLLLSFTCPSSNVHLTELDTEFYNLPPCLELLFFF